MKGEDVIMQVRVIVASTKGREWDGEIGKLNLDLCVQIRGWVAEALGSEKWRMASLHGLTVQLFSFAM
jgi:hypothetical protein